MRSCLVEYWHLPGAFGYGLLSTAHSWSLSLEAKIFFLICPSVQTPGGQEVCFLFVSLAQLLN